MSSNYCSPTDGLGFAASSNLNKREENAQTSPDNRRQTARHLPLHCQVTWLSILVREDQGLWRWYWCSRQHTKTVEDWMNSCDSWPFAFPGISLRSSCCATRCWTTRHSGRFVQRSWSLLTVRKAAKAKAFRPVYEASSGGCSMRPILRQNGTTMYGTPLYVTGPESSKIIVPFVSYGSTHVLSTTCLTWRVTNTAAFIESCLVVYRALSCIRVWHYVCVYII